MLTISALPLTLAICRLPVDAPPPAWATQSDFFALLRTPGELTAVTIEGSVPDGVTCEGGWRALKVQGPFAFTATGILASVLNPLADAEVGIFALSTYDTDYVLVKRESLDRAVSALRQVGHVVL